jgi:uncharacterized protein YyaL (SSP411 family)
MLMKPKEPATMIRSNGISMSLRPLLVLGLLLGLVFPSREVKATDGEHPLVRAVAQAQQLNRPIAAVVLADWAGESLLMERGVLAHPQVRQSLRDNAVLAVVQRDSWPELEAGLQAAFAAINGRPGGYPITVFCTPEGAPFEAIGYLPPTADFEGVGYAELITTIGLLWREDPDRIRSQAEALEAAGLSESAMVESVPSPVVPTFESLRTLANRVGDSISTGGIVRVGNHSSVLPASAMFLAAAALTIDHDTSADASERYLNSALRSPLRDHIQGGFFRSVDLRSRPVQVRPEKLLAVQAGWLRAFAAGHARTSRNRYVEACRELMRFLREGLEHSDGGWYAAVPGRTELPVQENPWLWSADDILSAPGVNPQDGRVLNRYLGLVPNQRRVPAPVSLLDPIAREMRLTYDQANQGLIRARVAATEARRKQKSYPQPLNWRATEWEAAAATAYLLAYEVTGDDRAKDFAIGRLKSYAAVINAPGEFSLPRLKQGDDNVSPAHYADQARLAEALLSGALISGEAELTEAGKKVIERARKTRTETSPSLSLERIGRALVWHHDGDLISPLATEASAWMLLDKLETGKGHSVQAREILTAYGRKGPGTPRGIPAAAASGWGWASLVYLASQP